jgi:TolB-like protein/DNA-binding winged helix-turn-helix (wHTH) protein/tetratricopeptide (TPR) repeat protein
MPSSSRISYKIGPFELRTRTRELFRGDIKLKLRPQAFSILQLLAERSGDLVKRTELQELLWSGKDFGDFENGLNNTIRELRGALGDSADSPRYIETLPKMGYRLIVPAEISNDPSGDAVPNSRATDPSPVKHLESVPLAIIEQSVSTKAPHSFPWNSRGLIFASLALTLSVALIWVFHRATTQRAAANPAIRSLAVLPLQNFSGNPDQDYLSDGMTEALIARLATVEGLRVISRTSVMQLKGTRKSVPAIGKELNVDAVIEGSVLRSGDKVRVTIQLIRTSTDEHLWAESYDREFSDVLALQSDVTQGIARHVQFVVNAAKDASSARPRTVAPDVYQAYLKGRFALNKDDRDSLAEALRFFQVAVDSDPRFAPAYAGMAATYLEMGTAYIGAAPDATRPAASRAARKALELDPELTEAHVMLGEVLQEDWQWSEAEAEYTRAIQLSPSDTRAHVGMSDWFISQGRTEESLAEARRAQELDPLTDNNLQVGWILFQSRRYDEAIRELRTSLTQTPDDPTALWNLGFALVGAQRFDEAIQTLEKAASLTNRRPAVLGVLVHAYAKGGRRSDALRVLDELHARKKKGYVPAAAFLNAYLGLGDKEQSFVWLEHAAQERSDILKFLKVHPFFDLLRDDPRFSTFLRRANLQ